MNTIVGSVSITGSRAARPRTGSASPAAFPPTACAAPRSAACRTHGLDQRGDQSLVAVEAGPRAQVAERDPAVGHAASSFAVSRNSCAISGRAEQSRCRRGRSRGPSAKPAWAQITIMSSASGRPRSSLPMYRCAACRHPVRRQQPDHRADRWCQRMETVAAALTPSSASHGQHRQAGQQQDLEADEQPKAVGAVQPRRSVRSSSVRVRAGQQAAAQDELARARRPHASARRADRLAVRGALTWPWAPGRGPEPNARGKFAPAVATGAAAAAGRRRAISQEQAAEDSSDQRVAHDARLRLMIGCA